MALFLPVLYVWNTDLPKYFTQISWSLVQQWNIIVITVCTTVVYVAEDVLDKEEQVDL